MTEPYFQRFVWRSGSFGQARYELSTAALQLGLDMAQAVGNACDQTRDPSRVASWLDAGQYKEVRDASSAYLSSQKPG